MNYQTTSITWHGMARTHKHIQTHANTNSVLWTRPQEYNILHAIHTNQLPTSLHIQQPPPPNKHLSITHSFLYTISITRLHAQFSHPQATLRTLRPSRRFSVGWRPVSRVDFCKISKTPFHRAPQQNFEPNVEFLMMRAILMRTCDSVAFIHSQRNDDDDDDDVPCVFIRHINNRAPPEV